MMLWPAPPLVVTIATRLPRGNQADALIEACVNGGGVGMFLSYQVAPLVAAGKLRLLLRPYLPPPVPVSVIYPHAKLLPLRTRLFVHWLRTELPKRLPAV